MKNLILVTVAALVMLAGCAQPEPPEVIEARKKAKTEVEKIIDNMTGSMGDVELTAQYRNQLVDLNTIGITEVLKIAINPNTSPGLAGELAKVMIERDEKGAVPYLIQMLDSPDEDVRKAAKYALQNITGEDFGFLTAPDSGAEHEDGILAWKKWWGQNKGECYQSSAEIPYPEEWDRLPE